MACTSGDCDGINWGKGVAEENWDGRDDKEEEEEEGYSGCVARRRGGRLGLFMTYREATDLS